MSRFLLGLTGGLAGGKSTVSRLLADAGFTVYDADRLVAELYRPGAPGARAVHELFGDEVMGDDGAVDKERLATIVFDDPEARRKLEGAVHPLVRQRFQEIAAATEGVLVYEATLLVESGRADEFDLVVSIEAPASTRLERAIKRGLDENAARARLEAQGDGAVRRERADRILENDGSLEELAAKVDALAAEVRALSGNA